MDINRNEVKEYVDLDAALARLGGKKAIYRKMLGLMLKSSEFADLKKSLDEKDYVKAEEVSHAIKGMTGNLSLPRLYTASTALNGQLKAGVPDETTVKDCYDAYEKTLAHIQQVADEIDAGN